MNRIYRLVWNRALCVLQVASEFTRGRTKGGRNANGGKHRAAWLAAVPLSLPLLALAAAPSTTTTAIPTATAVAANALPTGGQVTGGSGHLAQYGDTLTVTQQSQNLSLNWQTFNIGRQSTVDFVQPDASAIAVNRIADTNGSQIFGHLNANGQVFLINPNGVLFGQGAQVNVGALVASTLNVDDSTLGTGSLSFSGTGKGKVTNLGTINVTGGGYVALLANQVSNQGAIHAQLGSVALAGGNAVTLNFGGDKLVSVRVDQSALDALAQNGQLIEADGGNVWMTAGARDSLLASAVNNTGTIDAQTVQNQNGHIMLLGGMDAGTVTVGGTLDASAPSGGNGGQIETSAANVNVANTAKITTAAQLGLSGTWLIDPNDFTIAPSGGDISGATLSTELNSGNVTIASSEGGTAGSGNVNVDDLVSWSSHTLTLNAQNNININATMTASGTAGLVLNYSGTGVNVGLGSAGFAGQVNFTGSNTLSINSSSYTLISSVGALQGITTSGLSGHYALASNLTLSSGFTPIGSGQPFTGVFDGLGHTISGLTITNSSAADVGLFGVSSGTIRNVGLLGGSVSGSFEGADIGGLVGDNSGTISNVFTTGSVSSLGGGEWIGGLAGYNELSGTISNAYATGAVSSSSYTANIGGLVGTNYGSIRNAYATGSVSGSYGGPNEEDDIGGLVGYNTGTIANAYATGSVSWGSTAGTYGNFIGGLVGYSYGGGSITDAYATGHVSSVNSNDQLGGLVGVINNGTVTASYWDIQTTGQSSGTSSFSTTTTGMTGLSTSQMMQPGNFSWTIAASGGSNATWRIYNNNTTPLIESLLIPLTIKASNQTVTYNGTNQDAAALSSSSLASPNLAAITGLGLTTAQHAGSYTETMSSSAYSSNYDLSFGTLSATLTIDPAILTATLTNSGVTKTYNGTTAAPTGFTPTYSYSGLVAGDTGASLTDTGALYNSAHVASATDITVSGLNIFSITGTNGSLASDYILASNSASVAATITPATLTPTLTDSGVTKIYNGTTAAPVGFTPTYSYTGLISGDTGASLTDTSAAYNSAHVASATNVTVSGLSISSITGSNGSQASDYSLASSSASVAASITPATLTPTLTNSGVTKTYDGTTDAPIGFTPTYSYIGLVSGDTNASLNDTGVAYNSAHVASATDVTVSGLSINSITGSNGSLASDYSLASSSANVAATITPAPLTISLSNVADVTKTYDGTTAAPGGFSPTYSLAGLVAGDSATVSSSATPVFNSSHVVSATAITQGGLSLESITGNGSDNSVLGDYTLSNTTASTGAGVASISPIVLTATAPTIGGTLTKVYDGTAAANGASLNGGSVSGALSGDSLSLDSNGIALDYNSSHVISASSISASGSLAVDIVSSTNGSQSTDYSVTLPTIAAVAGTITPATLTPTLTNSGVTKIYDGTTNAPAGFTPTYSYSGLVSGDTNASLTDTSAAYNSAHVASATDVTVSGLSISSITGSNGSQASDYSLASSSVNTAATITPATLTLTLTNSSVTKIYDGTTNAPAGFTPTYSYGGLVSGDTSAAVTDTSATYNSADVVNASNVTVSGLSISGITGSNGSLTSDYSLASSSASVAASITPAALTASLTGSISKVYDGTTTATLTSGDYTLSGFVSGQGATVTQTSGLYNSSNVVGATTVTATLGSGNFNADSGTSLSNYTLPTSASGAASITPALLLVTANNANKTYDGAAYSGGNGVTYSGFVNGEGTSVLGGTLAYGGNSQGAINAGFYTITPSGLSSSNYTINYDNGALTVSPATLTASLIGTTSKVYDGTTAATLTSGNYTLTGVIGSDVVSLNDPTSGVYATANAGSGINVQASGLVISGSGASNYLLSNSTATAPIGTITPAPLTITANNASIIYNAQAYSGGNGATYHGFVDGQTAAVLGGTLTYGGSSQGALNVGNYTLTPGGLASGNYAITYDSGTLAISPATLTYVATPVQTYAGQSIPPLTGTVTGLQGSDTLTSATTGTLAFTTPATTQSMAGQYAVDGSGLAANDGDYVFVQAAGNAQALTVLLRGEAALPGVAFAQQQLGQLAPTATALPPGGLLVSSATLPSTVTAQDEETTPSRSSIPAGVSDLYTPDVHVIGGGVRLP